MMLIIRRIGLSVLAVAAVAVYFVMQPREAETAPALPRLAADARDYVDLLQDTLDDYDANAARTESAPQQQVVNGWVAKDLLSTIVLEGAQNAAISQTISEQNEVAYQAVTAPDQRDDRPVALLTIAGLAIAIWGATSVPPIRPDVRPIPIPVPDSQVVKEPLGHEELISSE